MLKLHQFKEGVADSFVIGWTVSGLPPAWYAVCVHPAGAVDTFETDPWKLIRGKSIKGQHGVEHFSLEGEVFPSGSKVAFLEKASFSLEGHEVLIPQWKSRNSLPFLSFCPTMSSYQWTYPGSYYEERSGRTHKNICFNYTSSSNNEAVITLTYLVLEPDGREHTVENRSTYRFDWAKGRAYVNGTGSYIRSEYLGVKGSISPVPTKWDGIIRSFLSVDDPDLIQGEIVRRCAGDAQYVHSNLYEFFKDLPSFGVSEIRAIRKLGKTPGLRNLASSYLSTHYGTRLTVSEAPQLWGDLFSPRKSSCRAAITKSVESTHNGITAPVIVSYHGKIFYSSEDDTSMLDELRRYGILPSIQDIWEIIPLSFAVDWFLDISSRLSVFDANQVFGRFPVDYFIFSQKMEQKVPAKWVSDGWEGNLRVRSYIRTVSPDLPQPSYYNSTPTKFNNIVELGALLLQRISH